MVNFDLINKEEEIREEILLNTNKLATINVKKDELIDVKKRLKACNEYLERENEKISGFSSLTDIEEKIQANKTKLNEYEKKLVDINIKLEKLGKYLNYKKELKEYNIFVKQREELLVEEKEKRECLSAANTLKNMIQEAESLAISNVINNINEHVQTYIELFFEDNPMSIQLLSFKEDKKKSKPQINLHLDYKGMECNIKMLSGGELQRVVVAFNLALGEMFNIPFILLDECTSNLDKETTEIIVSGVKEKYSQKNVVMIAHQVVSGLFDQVIKIE